MVALLQSLLLANLEAREHGEIFVSNQELEFSSLHESPRHLSTHFCLRDSSTEHGFAAIPTECSSKALD
jgi:hypothetical protein